MKNKPFTSFVISVVIIIVKENIMKTRRILFVSLIILFACGYKMYAVAAENQVLSRWEDKRRLENWPIYSLLIKSGGYGNGIPEPQQWETYGILKDPEREPKLREVLEKYPNSEYADDAALLLARAELFYHGDPNAAIEKLYKVISKYPDGDWIAEDRVWLTIISEITKLGKDGQLHPREPRKKRPGGELGESFVYLNYLEKEPHNTADEAKYWIAKIILKIDLRGSRYQEAVRNLKEVVEKHRFQNRASKDLVAAGTLKCALLKLLVRTEHKCHLLLIKAYFDKEDYVNVTTTAEDFLSINNGHPTCQDVHRLAGEAYESLEKWREAALHYNKYLSYPELAHKTRVKYEQKLKEVKTRY